MTDDHNEKPIEIKFAPGALEAIPPELRERIKADFEQVLATQGLAGLLRQSKRVEREPEDGCCPRCGAALVTDPDWDDEKGCPNPNCPDEGLVNYASADLADSLADTLAQVKEVDERGMDDE